MQYNNDIFQRGGYITVADFVEKWKDKYDITYKDGSYEERKEYLLEYCDMEKCFESLVYTGSRWINRNSDFNAKRYPLTLKPKNGVGDNVVAYAVNATSPDKKITLDKAIVVELEPRYDFVFITPEWFPMGLNFIYYKDEYESENKNVSVTNIGEILESNGLSKYEVFEQGDVYLPKHSDASSHNTYWKHKSTGMGCYIPGEKISLERNLFITIISI